MSKLLVPFLLVFMLVLSSEGYAQKKSVSNGISLKGSTGISTVHGDLTINPYGKLSDGKFGFAISGIKMFSPFFGIEVRYSSNNLSVLRTDLAEQFTGQVSEIGMSARIEPLKAFGPNGIRKIYPFGRIGVSNASYRAIHWDTNTSQIIPPSFGYKLDDLSNGPRENALSFPIAFGLGLRLSDKIFLEFEHSTSILNTDYLDATKSGDWNDMFGFTNIGIRYSLEPVVQTGVPRPRNLEPELVDKPKEETTVIETEEDQVTGAIDPFKGDIPYSKMYVESIVADHLISGDLFEVLLRIHKEDYTGPATLIQDLPPGFTAIKAPLRHANLDFENQQAKITWSQMPIDTLVTLRYHVHIDEKVSGPYSMKGRIWYEQPDGNKSYQFVNQFLVTNRNELTMDDKFLDILANQKTTANPYSTSVVVPQQNKGQVPQNQIDDLINNFEQTGQVGTSKKPGTISGQNSIDRQLGEGDLDKQIQAIIGAPTGSTNPQRNAQQTSDPIDDLINNFQRSGQAGSVNQQTNLQRNQTNANPARTGLNLSEEELDRQIESLISGGSGAVNLGQQNTGNQFVAKPGVEFRVQCGAFKSRSEAAALVRKHNISDPLQEEIHNGLYKYTVGSFNTYKEAQAFRDSFSRRTSIYSVFIVGYRNGVRQANINSLR